MRLILQKYVSPLCSLHIVTDEDGVLRVLEFEGNGARLQRFLRLHCGGQEPVGGAVMIEITDAFDAYFAGSLAAVQSLRTATAGTEFQREVWQALRNIEPGQTKSYGQIAAELNRPTASRAVGAANGANPISIVVPCHRVIGASGGLTGYGGTLPRKKWLLAHERKHAAKEQQRELCYSSSPAITWQ
jgi:methylated-DNA-[protein]-cysteine S-methyltransferase